MKTLLSWIACAIALASSTGVLAQNEEDCRRAQFGPEILERFPNAREACRDVITRDGQQYAVFKAQFEQAVGRTLHVRVRNPDGSRGQRMRIPTSPDFRVLVDGKPTRVRDLATDQELTAYVQVNSAMVALAPASEAEALQAVPFAAVSPTAADNEQATNQSEDAPARMSAAEEPVMPSTAGGSRAIGALGLLLIAFGGVMTARRLHFERKRKLQQS